MDRLWAPWRGEYVKTIPYEKGCFLCDAVKGEDDRATLLVRRDKRSFVILNRYPYTNGHVMVAPYRHVPALTDLAPDELSELMTSARDACAVLKERMNAAGFNVGINIGRVGGAGLKDHLHLHVVPRWEGDANFMVLLGDARVISQSLDAQWELLREHLR